MILKFLIEIISFLGVSVAQLIMGLLPSVDLSVHLNPYFTTVLGFCIQATNFLHFVIGDLLTIIAPLAIALVPIRFLVAPVVAFIRGFLRWGS